MPSRAKYCEVPCNIPYFAANTVMIKLLTIAILGVILYRMLFPTQRIDRPGGRERHDRDEDDYVDYEEID